MKKNFLIWIVLLNNIWVKFRKKFILKYKNLIKIGDWGVILPLL